MRIVVDANIVFSGILNSDGAIGNLLINSKHFSFIAPEYLRYEIKSKYAKLQRITGLSIERIMEAEYRICKNIIFISEEQITLKYWNEAEELVREVDIKDIQYVAYAKQFRGKLWSGDKKLINGLKAKGFVNVITTDELLIIKSKKNK